MPLIKVLKISSGSVAQQVLTDTVQFGGIGLGTSPDAGNIITSTGFSVTTSGNISKVNNVATSFPGVQGSSGSVLANDGAGNLAWSPVPASTGSVASESSVVIPKVTLATVTGSTQINTFVKTGWPAGAHVTLWFTGAPLVKNTAAKLAGKLDFQADVDTILGLVFDGTNWQETFRKIA